jgi:hypothetical protein
MRAHREEEAEKKRAKSRQRRIEEMSASGLMASEVNGGVRGVALGLSRAASLKRLEQASKVGQKAGDMEASRISRAETIQTGERMARDIRSRPQVSCMEDPHSERNRNL